MKLRATDDVLETPYLPLLPIRDLTVALAPARKGVIDVGFSTTLPLTVPIDWNRPEETDPTFWNRIHQLGFLIPQVVNVKGRGEAWEDDLHTVTAVLQDWIAAHPQDVSGDKVVWTGHPTAVRTMIMAGMAGIVADVPAWLLKALTGHVSWLKANYSGHWNHGLLENIALLAGSQVTGQIDMTIALARIDACVREVVDEQGAVNEQAVSYAPVVKNLLSTLASMYEVAKVDIPEPFDRRHRIARFIEAATQPDGMLVPIGDSLTTRGAIDHGPTASNARRIEVFDRGYIFGRDPWGEGTFFSLRFGEGRRIHGHRDHTSVTWFCRGRETLVEAGFGGYAADRWRSYERMEAGHNQVTIRTGTYQWQAKTDLVAIFSDEIGGWDSMTLSDMPYPRTERSRSILFHHRGGFVAVVDHLTVDEDRAWKFDQTWHLHESLVPHVHRRTDGGRVRFVRDDGSGIAIHQLAGDPYIESVVGRQDPLAGFRSQGFLDRIAVPHVTSTLVGNACTFVTVICDEPTMLSTVAAEEEGATIKTERGSFEVTFSTNSDLLIAHPM
ncbi:hypothetical protein BH23ACT5_BH23ACT5_01790 [soil metagenome]